MPSKKFRCKCEGEKCTWTRPIQDVQCEGKYYLLNTRPARFSTKMPLN